MQELERLIEEMQRRYEESPEPIPVDEPRTIGISNIRGRVRKFLRRDQEALCKNDERYVRAWKSAESKGLCRIYQECGFPKIELKAIPPPNNYWLSTRLYYRVGLKNIGQDLENLSKFGVLGNKDFMDMAILLGTEQPQYGSGIIVPVNTEQLRDPALKKNMFLDPMSIVPHFLERYFFILRGVPKQALCVNDAYILQTE